MGELTRLFGGEDVRRMVRERLAGRSSHDPDVGLAPRSEQPPGCTGDPDPLARGHHRACVVGWRWERECVLGRCAYRDPTGRPEHGANRCPGVRVIRRMVGGHCVTRDDHCDRRAAWGKYHETGPNGRRGYTKQPLRIAEGDERAPWDREPGSDG
jgi:hypothetical protein